MRKLVASTAAAATVAAGLALAPPANAAWTTIFPNYAPANCPNGGKVEHVKAAAFQGNTAIGTPGQSSVRLEVANRGRVQIVAQLFCVTRNFIRLPTAQGWYTSTDYVTNPVPWKSYYF
jgi:hypothetical protein